MKLTESQTAALRRLSDAGNTSQPTLWDINKNTVRALADRGLVGTRGLDGRGDAIGAWITDAGFAALANVNRRARATDPRLVFLKAVRDYLDDYYGGDEGWLDVDLDMLEKWASYWEGRDPEECAKEMFEQQVQPHHVEY